MLRLISKALVALALLAGPAAAQSFTLPELGLQSSGACRQLAARDRTSNAMIALGCLDTVGKGWNLTPKAIQIQGSGSTGDVSAMSATTNGVTATLARILGGTLTPRAFGGDPTLNDNSAALTAAFSSGLPIQMDGMYRATAPVTVNACPSIRGGNPASQGILWTAGGGGLTINCTGSDNDTSLSGVALRDLGLYTTATSNGGSPLTINFSGQTIGHPIITNGRVDGLRISGRDLNSQAWSAPVTVKNGQGLSFNHNFISGKFGSYVVNGGGSTGTTGGVRLVNDASVPAMTNSFYDNKVYFTDKAISIESSGLPGGEGAIIRDNILVADHVAINIDATNATYNPPIYVISGNQTETDIYNIFVTKSAQLQIDDNALYADGTNGTCATILSSSAVYIGSKNVCVGVGSGVPNSAVVQNTSPAYDIRGTAYGNFGGGFIQNFAIGIRLDANSPNWVVNPMSAVNVTQQAQDLNGTNLVMTVDGIRLNMTGLRVTAPSVPVEIGSRTTAGAAIVDFHTSGSTNAYDARILAQGGTSGSVGLGSLTMIGTIVEPTSGPPATATTACTTGQKTWDATYEYRCVAANTWKRTPFGTGTW